MRAFGDLVDPKLVGGDSMAGKAAAMVQRKRWRSPGVFECVEINNVAL